MVSYDFPMVFPWVSYGFPVKTRIFSSLKQDREVLRLSGGRGSAALGHEAGPADEHQAAQCGHPARMVKSLGKL